VTRAFYNAVALELQAREQNKKISLWLGDGPEETYHLTSAVLRPVMVNPSSEKAPAVYKRYTFIGRLLAKAIRDEYIIPLPLSAGLFAALFINDTVHPWALLEALAVPLQSAGVCVGLECKGQCLSRYDVLVALREVCDAVQDIEFLPEGERAEKLKELGDRQMKDEAGGWLWRLPRAYPWAKEQSTQEFLDVLPDMLYNWADEFEDIGEMDLSNVLEKIEGIIRVVVSHLQPQIHALRNGISEVMPLDALRGFSATEMLERFCGRDDVQWGNIKDITNGTADGVFTFGIKNAERRVFNRKDEGVKVLLHVLNDFTQKERKEFLQFCTSVPRVMGNISVTPQARNAVAYPQPTAHTCSDLLELPDYYGMSASPYPDAVKWDACEFNNEIDSDNHLLDAWKEALDAAVEAYPLSVFPSTTPPWSGASVQTWDEWFRAELSHPGLHQSLRENPPADVKALKAIYRGEKAKVDKSEQDPEIQELRKGLNAARLAGASVEETRPLETKIAELKELRAAEAEAAAAAEEEAGLSEEAAAVEQLVSPSEIAAAEEQSAGDTAVGAEPEVAAEPEADAVRVETEAAAVGTGDESGAAEEVAATEQVAPAEEAAATSVAAEEAAEDDVDEEAALLESARFRYAKALERLCFLTAFNDMQASGFREQAQSGFLRTPSR